MIHHALHLISISHEVTAQITTVELHTFHHANMGVTTLALLDGNHTILAYLTESFSEQLTNLRIVISRYSSYLLNLVIVIIHLLST